MHKSIFYDHDGANDLFVDIIDESLYCKWRLLMNIDFLLQTDGVWLLSFRDESPLKADFMQNMIEDLSESALSYYEFLLHLQQQICKWRRRRGGVWHYSGDARVRTTRVTFTSASLASLSVSMRMCLSADHF